MSDVTFPYTIWCINLVTRNDRYERAKNLFDSLNLNVEFYRTEKHSYPEEGCFNSHREVIRRSLEKGDEYCLIFEDDLALADKFTVDKLKYVLSEDTINKLPSNWNILYLGCYPDIFKYHVRKTEQDNIYHVHAIWAHAYIISRKYMEYIANLEYNEAIDTTYCKDNNTYAYLPSLILQGASNSDIGNNEFSNSAIKKWMFNGVNYYAIYVGQPVNNYTWVAIVLLVILLIVLIILIVYLLM